MKHLTHKIAKLLLGIFLFLFLLFNLITSQLISPLYFKLLKEDKVAVVGFLRKIKKLPVFLSFLEINKKIYGNSFEQEVLAPDIKRNKLIEDYELLLLKNPKSRDLLYNLYLLYQEDGNEIRAEEYLRRAKEIDPTLEN